MELKESAIKAPIKGGNGGSRKTESFDSMLSGWARIAVNEVFGEVDGQVREDIRMKIEKAKLLFSPVIELGKSLLKGEMEILSLRRTVQTLTSELLEAQEVIEKLSDQFDEKRKEIDKYLYDMNGLLNPELAKVIIQRDWALLKREAHNTPQSLSILNFSVDQFTSGSLSAPVVDKVTILNAISQILQNGEIVKRGTDTMFFEKDRGFVVALPRCGRKGAEETASRLRDRIERNIFEATGKNTKIRVTISVGGLIKGITENSPMEADIDALIGEAHSQMIEARKEGGNRVLLEIHYDDDVAH